MAEADGYQLHTEWHDQVHALQNIWLHCLALKAYVALLCSTSSQERAAK